MTTQRDMYKLNIIIQFVLQVIVNILCIKGTGRGFFKFF